MKRSICFGLCICLVLCLIACRNNREDIQQPVSFYYRTELVEFNAQDGIIASEIREAKYFKGDLEKLLNQYLKGPISNELRSPFPAAVSVEALTEADGVYYITLSQEFYALTGLELSMACACLTMTVMAQTQCASVTISVKDGLLDGNESITMGADNLLLIDSSTGD